MNNMIRSLAASLAAVTLMTSCEGLDALAQGLSQGGLGGPGLVGGLGGLGNLGGIGRGGNLDTIFKIIHIAVVYSERANDHQRELAANRASGYSISQKARQEGVRRKGVSVPLADGKGNGIMIVDENNRPVSKEVMVPKKDSISKGQVIDLGGDKVEMANSFHA